MPALARVGGGDQQKPAGVADVRIRAGDDDLAGFNGLAQRFQNCARELRELVHEQDTVMGQADLTWLGIAPAADDGSHRGCVVWLAKRANAADAAFIDQAGKGMDHRCFERLCW